MSGLAGLLLEPWRRVLRHWPLLSSSVLLAYFLYHGLHGERGLGAWFEVGRGLERARAELAALQAERRRLEAPVVALQPDRSDPDLLEEELRRLGYIGEQEAIVLTPAAPPPPVPAR